MNCELVISGLLCTALFLVLAPCALGSTTWYVDGVHGSENNHCMSPQNACRTIGHAISLASSGDTVIVAAATYTENLTIGISLKIIGSVPQQRLLMVAELVQCSQFLAQRPMYLFQCSPFATAAAVSTTKAS